MPGHTRRRLGRGLGWAGAAVSLLLAGVWVGSMRWEIDYDHHVYRTFAVADGGTFYIDITSGNPPLPNPSFPSGWTFAEKPSRARWWFYLNRSRTATNGFFYLFIPLWPFVLLTGVPSAGFLYATRRRKDPGVCHACGYDLTGLRANTPCPECGGRQQA